MLSPPRRLRKVAQMSKTILVVDDAAFMRMMIRDILSREGYVIHEAVNGRDYPIIMAVTMLSALMIVFGNLIADIAYAWADPRIRYE